MNAFTGAPLMTITETAEALSLSSGQVMTRLDLGTLLALAINCEDRPQRATLRIVRSSLKFRSGKTLLREIQTVVSTVEEWLFPGNPRCMVKVKDAAKSLRCSQPHIAALYDAKQIRAVNGASLHSTHRSLLVDRQSVVAFVQRRLCERSGIA